MPDRAHPPPVQRRVTDTDSDSKSSNAENAHATQRKRLDSTHKKHPLGKHTSVKPRMGPRSSSSRQVAQVNKEDKETRRHSADMEEVSPRNTGGGVSGKKERETKERERDREAERGASAMGSKSEWDDVVDLDGLKAKALEREASVMSLQALNLGQHKKLTGGMRRNRSAAEMAKRRLLLLGAEKQAVLKKSASHSSVNKAHNAHTQGRTSVHFDLGHQGEQKAGEEEVGDEDGWTEASGSASPNLSRSGSVAGQSSGRNSARGQSKTNSETPSMSTSPERNRAGTESRDWSQVPTMNPSRRESVSVNGGASAAAQARHPDATQITTRLLQRVASSSAAPQMSAVSATAMPSTISSFSHGSNSQKDSTGRSQPNSDAGHSSGTATPNPSELISRFKGSGPGTPGESPLQYHSHLGTRSRPTDSSRGSNNPATQPQKSTQAPTASALDSSRRAKSMSNLVSNPSGASNGNASDSDDRPLAPRSRQSSSAAYVPPPQSRTQQKLWLQRASSNMESAPPTGALGLNLALNGLGVGGGGEGDVSGEGNPLARTLVGSIGLREGERGRETGGRGGDPRVRIVLERAGMTYRAVGRFVDPVVRGLRRLDYIPGSHRGATRIPPMKTKSGAASVRGAGAGAAAQGGRGLSQSLKDARGGGFMDRSRKSMDAGSKTAGGQPRSFDAGVGQAELGGEQPGDGDEEEEVRMLLRSLWEADGCRRRLAAGEGVDE